MIVALLFALFCISGITAKKPIPGDDKNTLDKIFEINQISSSSDTYSPKINVNLFEGDIWYNKRLKAAIGEMRARSNEGMSAYDAISRGAWPGGVVPYTFASGFPYRADVLRAIGVYNRQTCIRFKPYTRTLARSAGGYVEFFVGGGCYSMIGRQGGKQRISIGRGCNQIGVTIHEMMHALGFYHEQSRRDRDQYITINWSNINRAMWYNFEKYRAGKASTLNEPYDKSSVMHYGNYAFSINGRKTIVSKRSYNEKLGQRAGLSKIDVNQLKKYYKCGGTTPVTAAPPTSSCTNVYPFCSLLNGWCSNSFVKTNCKKTCKLCKSSNCKDLKKHCAYWKGRGFCTSTHAAYMATNCKKSCNKC